MWVARRAKTSDSVGRCVTSRRSAQKTQLFSFYDGTLRALLTCHTAFIPRWPRGLMVRARGQRGVHDQPCDALSALRPDTRSLPFIHNESLHRCSELFLTLATGSRVSTPPFPTEPPCLQPATVSSTVHSSLLEKLYRSGSRAKSPANDPLGTIGLLFLFFVFTNVYSDDSSSLLTINPGLTMSQTRPFPCTYSDANRPHADICDSSDSIPLSLSGTVVLPQDKSSSHTSPFPSWHSLLSIVHELFKSEFLTRRWRTARPSCEQQKR